jgi:hypothetical protein
MITFLGMPARTSGEIRGRQVAERLHLGHESARFVDVHNPNWDVIKQNKIALFVRTWEPNLAKQLVQKGFIVGYEVADMPVGDAVFRNANVKDLSAYAHDECSFFVVNNSIQLQDMHKVIDKPVYVIPHHTTNFDNVSAPFRTIPNKVGYVGLPEQLSGKSELEKLCVEHNCEFVSVHPNTREECDKVFRSLDVGIVFAESDSTMSSRVVELMRRYKPNTKLSNFQAYGIPTICTPYESYKEHGGNACIFVDDLQSMLSSLKILLTDTNKRLVLSNQSLAVGKQFHISKIINLYEKMALEVSK